MSFHITTTTAINVPTCKIVSNSSGLPVTPIAA